MSEATGVKMAHVTNKGRIPKLKEYIIIARKSGIKDLFIEKIPKEKWDNEYKTVITNLTKKEINYLKAIRENEERSSIDIIKADEILAKIIMEPVSLSYQKLGIKDEKAKNDFNFENAWRIIRTVSVTGSAKSIADKKRIESKSLYFSIVTPKKKMYFITSNYDESMSDPRIKLLFADDYLTIHPGDIWTDIKTTGLENEGGVVFKKGKKPETLLKRIIDMSTEKNDWVLDSFAGSGTTGAVAHKMSRKWIMIELGNHCLSHTLPRLKKVINNEDNQGITESINWKGGGGFKYYELAPSLLNKDKYNQWVINPNYNAQLLAAAMAKQEGFIYNPSETIVWKQGSASENHFIYTTTNTITRDVVEQILSEMKPDESLRICCVAFAEGCNTIDARIEIKKIPEVLLGKCEFGKEDYSTDMNIVNMPIDPDRPVFVPSYIQPESKPTTAKIKKNDPLQTNLLF
jgi:adenine-specific DNA-methyltransferase